MLILQIVTLHEKAQYGHPVSHSKTSGLLFILSSITPMNKKKIMENCVFSSRLLCRLDYFYVFFNHSNNNNKKKINHKILLIIKKKKLRQHLGLKYNILLTVLKLVITTSQIMDKEKKGSATTHTEKLFQALRRKYHSSNSLALFSLVT